ncbi:FtsX-like permease family protein [Peptoniphilus equinus]|uniref:FtsX-like permease family protein n=1 Tax=Peptoniphilus equinus TaxID=3016343 RepID=A0ABY7QTL6_9FIRM|nr:FtsX-like permease family protein [Peptoniphilus equinus]WBW50117.1 FtsX-like permease family protein [Peptoniphilus equinus]
MNKDLFREIKKTWPRFLSILLMVLLGVFVLVGLMSTAPIMRQSAEAKIDAAHMHDVLIDTALDLTAKDRQLIESQEGLKELEYGYEVTLKTVAGDLFTLRSLPEHISKPLLVSGRLPEGRGELLLDQLFEDRYRIGDTLAFNEEERPDPEADPALDTYSYTVVGFAQSVEFVSERTRGTSFEGGGSIQGFAYVDPSHFQGDISSARLIFDDTAYPTSSKAYSEHLTPHLNRLDIDFRLVPTRRYNALRADVEADIRDGAQDIEEAKEALKDGQAQLEDGEAKLAEGREALYKGEADFNAQRQEGATQLDDAKKELDDAKTKLADSKQELDEGKRDLADGDRELRDSEAQLKDAAAQIQDGKRQLQEGEDELREGEGKYREGLGELSGSKKTLDSAEAQLRQGKETLEQGRKDVEAARDKYQDGVADYEVGLQAYRDGEADYEAGLQALAGGLGAAANLDAVQTALGEKQVQLARLESAVLELDGLKAKRDELTSQQSRAQGGLDQITAGLAEIDAALQGLSDGAAREALLQKKAALQDEASLLNTQLIQLEAGLATIDGSITTLEKTVGGLNVAALKGELAQGEAALKALRAARTELDTAKVTLDSSKEQLDAGKTQLEAGEAQLQEGEQEYLENLKKFADGKAEYNRGVEELNAAKEKLDSGRMELEVQSAKLREAENAYEEGKDALGEGKVELERARRDYENGVARYEDGVRDYEDGLSTYETSKATFDDEIKQGAEELAEARDELYKNSADLAQARVDFIEEKSDAEADIAQGEADLADGRKYLELMKIPRLTIQGRHHNGALNGYLSDASRVDLLAKVFPGFFFLVAMLVTTTTMRRMVDDGRIQIGTYKALGYSNNTIGKKYVGYGGLGALAGGVLGASLGSFILPRIVGNAYATTTIFENHLDYRYYPGIILGAVALGLIFGGVSAWLSVRHILKENTASLLRVRRVQGGSRIFLERTPLWRHMSFLRKVTARNIFRYKKRMIMTIFGIMGCTALLILGFGIKDSVREIETKQFDRILGYDLMVTTNADYDEASYDAYTTIRQGKAYTSVYMEPLEYTVEGMDETLTLLVTDDGLSDVFMLQNRKTKAPVAVPQNGALVNEKLKTLLKLQTNDILEVKNSEREVYGFEVAGDFELYLGNFIVISKDYYEKVFGATYEPNTDLYQDGADIKTKVEGLKAVVNIVDNNDLRDTLDQYLNSINMVQVVITVASSLLGLVVLYNLTNINIEERRRELSSIKVLGFYPKEVTAYVYRETWLLTLLGIVLGCVGGFLLHSLVLRIVVPHDAMLDPVLSLRSYGLAVIITILVNAVIMVLFHFKIKAIDMVESLKSNE